MKASIEDVARQAGVSTATVSRAFSRPDMVSAKTRAKVMEAAQQLDFSVSRMAGILKSGRSHRVALLVGVALGLVLGLVAFKIYRVGIFLLSFGAVYTMFYALIPISWVGIVVGIAGGILAGILAVKFLRPVIILTTGIGYGLSAGQMLLSLFKVTSLAVILPVGAALALAGILVQFKTTKPGE